MSGKSRRGQLRPVAIAVLTVAMVVSQPAAVVSVSADSVSDAITDGPTEQSADVRSSISDATVPARSTSFVDTGEPFDRLNESLVANEESTSSVGPLSDSEESTVLSYLDAQQVGYVSDQVELQDSRYVGVVVVQLHGVPSDLRHEKSVAYTAGYYLDSYWNDITQILVFERVDSGIRLVTDEDTIAKVLQAQTGKQWSQNYANQEIQPWIKSWTDRVVNGPQSTAVFGWEKLSRLQTREDAYLAALQGMTTTNTEIKYIPNDVRQQLKNADSASGAASAATDAAQRIEVGEKIEVAGELVDSRKTKQALQKFADDIQYVSENTDKIAYAGSVVSLVMAVSEQRVYADYKIRRLKRVQQYAHSTSDVTLDEDLDGAITRLIEMHENSDQKTAEAISKWIDTSSVDLASTAAPTVAQKFGTWLVTKSSYAASASTWATSGTAGTLLSGAASVAGAGVLGWQIGGLLVNRQGMYVTMKRAEFSQNAMTEFGNIADELRASSGAEFKSDGVIDGDKSRTFYSAAYFEKIAQVQTYKYVSESFDSTWVDERLGDLEELIRILEGNEYVSDEKAVENTLEATSSQLDPLRQTSLKQVLGSYPTERRTVASLSISNSPATVTPGGDVLVDASVTDRAGNPVSADDVSYRILETGTSGGLIGSNGEYSYGITAPDTPGTYTVKVTAMVGDRKLSKKRTFTVSDGNIGVSVGSITASVFPGGTTSQRVTITNNGQTSLSNVAFSSSGNQASWLSVTSREPDWRPRSQSFELITPSSNDQRVVTVTASIPDDAEPGTYSGLVTVSTVSGNSLNIPVSVDVTERGERIEQDEERLSDSDSRGWDVSSEVARERTVPKWTDAGHRETVRSSGVTVDDSWTEVGSFSADEVGIQDLDHWIATDVDWQAPSDAEGSIRIRINGESNDESYRADWGGLNAQPYHLDQSGIPTIEPDENTVEFKYVSDSDESVRISEVEIEPETAELDERVWSDEADIDSEELSTLKSAYLTLDAKAMSDATAHPLRVFVNGKLQGTVSAPYDEWDRDQRVTVDPSVLSAENTVKIETSPKGIYNVDDAELVYSYVSPPDIDTTLSANSISVAKGDRFSVGGTILNDGGRDATDTDYSLSYDSSTVKLVSGSQSGTIGRLSAGESTQQEWTFRAVSGGTASITLVGDADQSDESADTSVTINTYDVRVSNPGPVTSSSDTSTVTYSVRNTGSVETTVSLDPTVIDGPDAWSARSAQRSVTISSGESAQIPVSVSTSTVGSGGVELVAETSSKNRTDTTTVRVTRRRGENEDPDADDPGDERFADGEYRDRWDPTAESDETIRLEDEHLIHDSPATDTPDANLLGENYYEAEGTVTISVRQRQADTDYWRSGFGLVFDETTIQLAEHKRGSNDDLTLFADGETDVAPATDSTDWQRYNITVNFETMTVESVRRGDEVYEVDAGLPDIEDETFQLTLGLGPGHDTRYDVVRVRGTDPVGSVPPDAKFEVTTTTPAPGESVIFNASATTDPDSPIQRYEWDFDGDGTVDATTIQPTVTHTYDEAGSYHAELVAVDIDNDRDGFDRTIQVGQPAIPDPVRPPEFDGSNYLDVTAQNASGESVAGAEVVLYNSSGVELGSKVTRPTGNVTWSTLVAGTYGLELYGPDGAFWVETTVTVESGGTATTVQRTTTDDDSTASATGDPHLTTFDGVSYDFQAAGEFVLARDDSLAVQARLRPVSTRQVSVVSAVATRVDGQEITIDARDGDVLTVAGETRSLASGESSAVGDGRITREGRTYTVVYPGANGRADPGDERLAVDVRSNRVDVTLTLDDARGDDVEGLLGSPDGNASNDVAYANGTAITTPVAFETLYGPFRDDYRVTASTSLFDYADGESPSTFFDADYPSQRVTVADLGAQERQRARQQAQEAGLDPGTPEFADAVLDYGLTDDPSYVDSAAQAAEETNATVDATPAARIEFDDAVVANGTDTLTVDRVTYTGGAHYAVVYADASPGDDGFDPGVRIGRSAELGSGTAQDVAVTLSRTLGPDDDVAALRSNRTLGVRLHRADTGSVGTPVRRDGRAVESAAAFTARDERITITNPTGEYVVVDDVTINGTATESVDEVVLYARNATGDRYVGLDLTRTPRSRDPTAIEVTDTGQFAAENAILAFGSDAFATYGPVDVAAVPARAADRSDDDPAPDRSLPGGYVADVTNATATVEVVPQRLNATVRSVGSEVALEDGLVRIEGTARGNNVVSIVLVGSNGAVVTEEFAVDEDGRFGDDIPVVGRTNLPPGRVEVFVLAENRDGTLGDGILPNAEGPISGDELGGYLAALDADSAAAVESALRKQTVDDDGPELRGAPFSTGESDDLLETGSFQLAGAETAITRVAPAGSDAAGVTPIPPGATMVVDAETNLRPGDNAITVELRDSEGTAVRSAAVEEWSANGTVTARLDTAGLAAGSYSLVVDDDYDASTTAVTLGAPTTPETLVVAPGADGDYSSIDRAVENARAGGTVEVRPGTYHETVDVSKSITLVAPDGATLDGNLFPDRTLPVAPNRSAAAIEIGNDASPTIEGFTVRNYDAAAIYAFGTTEDWTLRNVTIHDATIGVGASGSDGAWRLDGVRIRNVTSPIYADGTTGAFAIRDTVLRSNRIALVTTNSTGDWTLHNTTIRNTNGTAVYAVNTTGRWSINESTLADNDRGINATGAAQAGDASHNWWGDPSGPAGTFAGAGDTVTGNVTVNPYYADADLTTTATVAAPSPGPANVTVAPPSLPANATLGTTLAASVTVTNVGGRNATQEVGFRLDVDGDGTLEPTDLERQDRTSVALGSGERRTVRLEAYTDGLDPGTYRYGVFTANDSATGVVNVTRPPGAAATVTLGDRTVANGTRTVRVDRANYTGGRYYVVVHAVGSPGDGTVDPGTPLGNSTELSSGVHTDVSVDLDPVAAGGDSVDALTRDRSLVAVIHRTDPGGSFDGIVRADGRPVADAAALEVRDVSQVTVGPPDSDVTFGSIAHAIDSVREGGTVVLRPGTYATQVRLDRNVTLAAPDGATISGRAIQETVTTGVVVADGASPTVEGLTIRDFDWGVSAQDTAGDWTLRNVAVRNVDIGVQAAGATGDWAVRDSTVVDADAEAVQARRTTGDWTVVGSTLRDGSGTAVDATRAAGDWVVGSTTVRGVEQAAVEATRTEGDWTVRATTVRNATEGIDATRAAGDWVVRDTDVRDSVLGAVVAVDATGDWVVENATLRGNYRGVNATRAVGAWTITGSRLVANGRGLDARAAAGSATRNWWGGADGPSGVFDGSGDAVRGPVLVRPFYTDADLTTLSAPVRASVTFDGTTVPPGTTTVRIDRANYTGGPYVIALARERSPGDGEPNRSAPVGVSETLSTGRHTDVPVDVGATLSGDDGLDSLDANATLVARLYRTGLPNATGGVATNATDTAAVTVERPTATVAAGTVTTATNGTVTVPIRAGNVTDAVYFATTVSYDPAVANVTDVAVPGIDYDPTVAIDNESGTARVQAQYAGRDAPAANLTFDVTATTNASTPLRVESATVYRGDAADPTVETANGRLTVVEPRATVTNTTLDVTTVRPNRTVTVTATLSNPRSVTGPVTVPLRVDGATATTLTRTLPAGGTANVTFAYTPESTGTRTLAVGDGATRTLTVAAVDIEETNTTTRVGGRTAPGTPLSAPLNGTNGTTDAGVSLDRLNVSTTRETDVSLSVNVSADPSGAPALGDAAAYINVSESAPEDAFERVVFEFTVETERLTDPSTAELYRYHDGSWNALETTYLGVEDGVYQFQTVAPGLSVFAVRETPSSAEDDADGAAAPDRNLGDRQDTRVDSFDDAPDDASDATTPAPEPEPTDDTTPDDSTVTPPDSDDGTGTAAPPGTPEPDTDGGSTATPAPAPDREATPASEPAGFDPRGIGALAVFLVAVVLGVLWYRRR